MNKTVSIIIVVALAVLLGIIFVGGYDKSSNSGAIVQTQNIEIRDGIQYVYINARGGYSPKVSNAQSNIPTKLVVKTNGTYDCSASLVIRSIGYQKILTQTGEELIDLGTPETNSSIQGTCGMGMYSFRIQFF